MVMVADLGLCLAKVTEGGADGVWKSGYCGTRGFIAPEVADLKGSHRDRRVEVRESADVYSLGRVLACMLGGREGVSEEVTEMMKACMASEAEGRPSVAEVLGVLHGVTV